MNNIITWCNANQGFMNVLLAIGTLAVSTIAVYISIRSSRKDYNLNVFKMKQEIYDSFKELSDVVAEYEKFDDYIDEVLDNEMPMASMKADCIIDFYEEKIKHLDKTVRDAFNKSDYLYLEYVSQIDKDLKNRFLEWCDALYTVSKTIKDEAGEYGDEDTLLLAIEKILLITPDLIENLDKANQWLRQDLRKSLPKQGIMKNYML